MLKLLTELKGSKVILYQEQALVGPVDDYLFDHETGVLLGIFVVNPIDKKQKIIPMSEVKGIGQDTFLVSDLGSLMELEDYIRGAKAARTNAKIIMEIVKTQSGKILGKVDDVALDTLTYKIERLYVKPKISLKNLPKELIIPASKIIEIDKKTILVLDETVTVKAKNSAATVPAFCE